MQLIANYNNFEVKFWDNDKLIFSGVRSIERFRYKWQLFDPAANLISNIKLKPYFISFSLNEEYLVSYTSNNRHYNLILYYKVKKGPHYEIIFNDDHYEIILHKGNKVSFFKNQQQFAYLTEKPLTISPLIKLHIVANDDINISFFCTLIYGMMCKRETNDANLNFNFGNLSSQLKQFDAQWQPG